MDMTRITAAEFQKSPGTHSDAALQAPVAITKHGRDHLVLLSAKEYERLKRRDRGVGLIENLPESTLAAIAKAKVPDEYAHLDKLMEPAADDVA
jgi:PHD/YefM family antitoxin component YafN of YafNO toxin-antitoxin module